MDDWVILSPSRWKLRKAIAIVNQLLEKLKVKQHPHKTFIGRIRRGFDFLGYRFSPSGLGIAQPTVTRFLERARRLYEQGADAIRIDEYVRRWWKWVRGGIDSALAESVGSFVTMVGGGVVLVSNGFQPSKELLPLFHRPSKTENRI